MNPNQFATLEEAKAIAAKLTSVGGGVADIYVAEMVGPFSAATIGDARFYHFRFRNGADGFNVGLIRTMMQSNPSRWPLMLAAEVNSASSSPAFLY